MIEILKKFDLFSVEKSFSFGYKNNGRYVTGLTISGFICTILTVISFMIFGIYYFVPFIGRKNFTVYLNTINLPQAEPIDLDKSNTTLAIGLECDNDKNGQLLKNLLDLNIKYYKKSKNENLTYDKDVNNISYYNCNYIGPEFFKFDSANPNKTKILKCLNLTNKTIEGSYGDNKFEYYEISLKAKNYNYIHIDEIDETLLKHDCKLELHYSDTNINYTKHKHPINTFINEIFIQLNPDFLLKMNTFFMNQEFYDDDDLFLLFNEEPIPTKLFSRTEQYFLYKGKNKGEGKRDEFAKIYIRADTKKVIIKRKYQNVMEFYADTFEFLVALVFLVKVAFRIINYCFYVNHSIENDLFLFKEENNKPNKIINDSKVKMYSQVDPHSAITDLEKAQKYQTSEKLNQKTILKKNNYSFNIIELFTVKYLKCFKCCTRKMKYKTIIYEKACNILDSLLDIRIYIKSILFLDIYQYLINEDKKRIINFLTMPITPSEEEGKEDQFDEIYKYYKENDFNDNKFEEGEIDDFENLKKGKDNEINEISKKEIIDEKLHTLYKQHFRNYFI